MSQKPHNLDISTDWLVVGRFGRPHGIKGFITVVSFTEPRENILDYTHWHIGTNNQWQPINVLQTTVNNKFILAQIEGYTEREQVAQLTNVEIAVKREQLPTLKPDEYYWHELVGMNVVTQQGLTLGTVSEIMATGSNDVLVVLGEGRHLIPFLPDDVILEINPSQRLITVDWDPDF